MKRKIKKQISIEKPEFKPAFYSINNYFPVCSLSAQIRNFSGQLNVLTGYFKFQFVSINMSFFFRSFPYPFRLPEEEISTSRGKIFII